MRSSSSSASLWPPRAKNLMPLSGIGLWRGREHHAEVGAERLGEVGDRGRRQHADAQHVDARAGEPGHDGGLQELPRRTRVAPDDRDRPVALERRPPRPSTLRRGDREVERELGGQVALATPRTRRCRTDAHTAYTCSDGCGRPAAPSDAERRRPEHGVPTGGDPARRRGPRTPQGPISACCTAEPCGPSSGRPSCAPWPAGHG